MSSFEINKICAAVLVALLTAMASVLLGEGIVHTQKLKKNVYIIEVSEAPSSAGAADKPIDPVGPLLVHADKAAGEALVKKLCTQCHSFEKGGPNKTGPNLFGIIGLPFAHKDDFSYSRAFREKHETEKWDEEKLNQYLVKPAAYMKGTKMAFAGIKKPEDRANVIAFLKSLV